MLQAKKASLNQAQRMEIAGLLKNGKEESARIKVERIIREDFLMEAMEILELYCELLLARFGLLEQMKYVRFFFVEFGVFLSRESCEGRTCSGWIRYIMSGICFEILFYSAFTKGIAIPQ